MIQNFKKQIWQNLISIPGWRTKRRIIVIESDDWGSNRMPTKQVYHQLLKVDIQVDKCPYNMYDSLADEDDLNNMFNTLLKFRDIKGNSPVITANTIVANPDFEKIKKANFEIYHYELFTDTLKKTPGRENSFEIWKQGIAQKLFYPQFHGREHLNVNRWMKNLRQNMPETRKAFDLGVFGISTTISSEKRRSYMAALDFDDISELEDQKKILAEGLDIFEQIFGYKSQSYIATNYNWHHKLEETLDLGGVKYIQGAFNQREPQGNNQPSKLIRNPLGKKNKQGQTYLVRNCNFEPSMDTSKDWVMSCLNEIETAFRWNKPAVISTHRLNYIGSLVPMNRDRNLILLSKLLEKIILRWPEVEFMNTVQLGSLISKGKE